ncbi:hypothetical protein B0H14DRAFT_2501627 [Mycena olivaceomarginata]|nr:hypothetical protein B0H14DRAFT_2501627 [Mycena olivaceomarginata]
MVLNARSRESNLHAAMNSLFLWNGQVSKRVVETLNHYAFCNSPRYQAEAIQSISKDSLHLARTIANDPERLIMLPNDNFNWVGKAWETSALHTSVMHDQVSAILVVLPLPAGSPKGTASRLANAKNFALSAGTRHKLTPEISLEQILPDASDQNIFEDNAIRHVAHILAEEIAGLSVHYKEFGKFFDPHALPITKTEEYYLPTYDQEQASTRGNMLVMEHYFRDVLQIPKETFQARNFFLLGDRLTTARERAAQDQRSVDRSEHRFDHLASFEVLSGIMHFVMNQVQNIGKNAWGGTGQDSVSLSKLLEKLPSHANINLKKIDFYAWLRFLDVILRGLVLRAAMVLLKVSSPEKLYDTVMPVMTFKTLCGQIVRQFLMPSIDRLEAIGVKKIGGNTESGNAVLLMHDLMTVREIRHAIKHGHPERMQRILKYWTPMFYAGGSYNYANESMELLHNLIHDWPADISPILRGGMLVNNQGQPAKHKETDIRVEQFNKIIKSHTHGANARPGLLEKITPAIGHIQELTEQIYEDLGVGDGDQHHSKVSQHKDVQILLKHFSKSRIFEFPFDKSSKHSVVDLYRTGLQRLAGHDGGHAKHLRRHILRSRIRHAEEPVVDGDVIPPVSQNLPSSDQDVVELMRLEHELELDNERPKLTLIEQLDEAFNAWREGKNSNEDVYE